MILEYLSTLSLPKFPAEGESDLVSPHFVISYGSFSCWPATRDSETSTQRCWVLSSACIAMCGDSIALGFIDHQRIRSSALFPTFWLIALYISHAH